MQLDRATPALLPFLVQVNQQIDAAMQHPPLVDIEVDVDIQSLPIEILVRSSAEQRLVCDQIGDPGQRRHRVEEGTGIDIAVELAVEGADRRHTVDHGFSADCSVLVDRPAAVECGKIGKERFGRRGLEKVFDQDVTKWRRVLEALADTGRSIQNFGTNHWR
jgi:hypothetical protein